MTTAALVLLLLGLALRLANWLTSHRGPRARVVRAGHRNVLVRRLGSEGGRFGLEMDPAGLRLVSIGRHRGRATALAEDRGYLYLRVPRPGGVPDGRYLLGVEYHDTRGRPAEQDTFVVEYDSPRRVHQPSAAVSFKRTGTWRTALFLLEDFAPRRRQPHPSGGWDVRVVVRARGIPTSEHDLVVRNAFLVALPRATPPAG